MALRARGQRARQLRAGRQPQHDVHGQHAHERLRQRLPLFLCGCHGLRRGARAGLSPHLQRLGLPRERCRARDSEDRLRPAEQPTPHPVHQRQRDEVHLQRGGREAARDTPHGGAEHQRARRQRQGTPPLGDTERGLHGLPPGRQPHAEERARRQAPVRGGLLPGGGVFRQRQPGRHLFLLLRPRPSRQHPPGRQGRPHHKRDGRTDDGLLSIRCAVLRRLHGQRGAVKKVQRQGAGQDARAEHLRLWGKAVQPRHRTLGQGGPVGREEAVAESVCIWAE